VVAFWRGFFSAFGGERWMFVANKLKPCVRGISRAAANPYLRCRHCQGLAGPARLTWLCPDCYRRLYVDGSRRARTEILKRLAECDNEIRKTEILKRLAECDNEIRKREAILAGQSASEFQEAVRREELARKKREFLNRAKALGSLRDLKPEEFQRLMWAAYRKAGYEVQETSFTKDGGVDGFLVKGSRRLVLQCKRYKGNVGEPFVRDLLGTMIHNSANGAILVTTAGISEPARKFADGKGIELVDGDALLSFLREADLSEDLLPDDLVS
jgi:restriction endonuclease Mrr